jgi:hypothetical protein
MNVTDIVKFQTNIPEELAFTYEDGREVEGRFGTQYFRQTTDGRGVYLQPFVEKRLLELEIKPGQRVSICKAETKDGRKKGIRWDIKRVDPPAETAPASPGKPGQPAKITPAPQRTTVEPNVQVQSNTPRMPAQRAQPNPPQPVQTASTAAQPEPDPILEARRPLVQTQMSATMASCFIAAIDALIVARDYAQSKSIDLRLHLEITGGELQDLATSIYIAQSKQSNINLMNRNQNLRATNGGTEPWQH